MLETGKQVSHFFNVSYDEYGRKQWRLKSLEEYEREHPNAKEQPSKKFFAASTLPEIIKTYPNQRKGIKQADLERGRPSHFRNYVQADNDPEPIRRAAEPTVFHRLRVGFAKHEPYRTVDSATGAYASFRS